MQVCGVGFKRNSYDLTLAKMFRCVHCTRSVDALYTEYSRRNIRLLRCPRCSKVSDPFVEMGILELFVAVLLHRPLAYVHAIHNRGSLQGTLGKELWSAMFRVPLLAMLAEGFVVWSCCRTSIPSTTSEIANETTVAAAAASSADWLDALDLQWIANTTYNFQSSGSSYIEGTSQHLFVTMLEVGLLQMILRFTVCALAMITAR